MPRVELTDKLGLCCWLWGSSDLKHSVEAEVGGTCHKCSFLKPQWAYWWINKSIFICWVSIHNWSHLMTLSILSILQHFPMRKQFARVERQNCLLTGRNLRAEINSMMGGQGGRGRETVGETGTGEWVHSIKVKLVCMLGALFKLESPKPCNWYHLLLCLCVNKLQQQSKNVLKLLYLIGLHFQFQTSRFGYLHIKHLRHKPCTLPILKNIKK